MCIIYVSKDVLWFSHGHLNSCGTQAQMDKMGTMSLSNGNLIFIGSVLYRKLKIRCANLVYLSSEIELETNKEIRRIPDIEFRPN